jgi:hypothetical protein
MTATITDAKVAALGASVELKQAMAEFQREFFAPDILRAQGLTAQQVLNQWDARAPELEQVAQQNPEVYGRASKTIKAIRDLVGGTAPRSPTKSGG